MGTQMIETHASECTQCPVSSSSSTTPGNMSCIIGKLCLLIYLLVYRSVYSKANEGLVTHLLLFPLIATTWPSFQVRPPGPCGKSTSTPNEFPSIRKGTLNFAGSLCGVSKFVNKKARIMGSCADGSPLSSGGWQSTYLFVVRQDGLCILTGGNLRVLDFLHSLEVSCELFGEGRGAGGRNIHNYQVGKRAWR
jgi:hypothetical protein